MPGSADYSRCNQAIYGLTLEGRESWVEGLKGRENNNRPSRERLGYDTWLIVHRTSLI